MLAIQRYRLAQPQGDGRHPYLDGDGAYLGLGTPLVERRAGADGRLHFAPRPEAMLDRVLSAGYGRAFDSTRLMGSLGTVSRALDAGNVTLALIALVQAGIDPLPDEAAAQRLKKADIALRKMLAREGLERTRKYSPDQPRVPAGNPDGGQWTSEGADGGGEGDASSDGSPDNTSVDSGAVLTDAVYRPGDETQYAQAQLAVWIPPFSWPDISDMFGLSPHAPSDVDAFVPDNALPPNARLILGDRTLLPDGSISLGIPPGYVKIPSNAGDGVVYRAPGTDLNDNANTIRIMPPNSQYPTGRVIIYNSVGQAISPYSGQTGSKAEYHYLHGGVVPKP